MKAYLKSGQTIRVSQKIANAIVDAKKSGDGEFLTEHFKVGKNVKTFIDVREVIAIR